MKIPSTWSRSALVRSTPSMEVPRTWSGGGKSLGKASIWWRISGEALRRNQDLPSALTVAEDWERGDVPGRPERASRQRAQLQFHWGKPPPAAVPSKRTYKGKPRVGTSN